MAKGRPKENEPTKKRIMETKVNRINPDGTTERFCLFVNDYDARYNMITLCMQMYHNSSIWDAAQREKYAKHLMYGVCGSVYFEINNVVYITSGLKNYVV